MKRTNYFLASYSLLFFLASAPCATAAGYKYFTATVDWNGTPAANVPVLLRLSETAIQGFDYDDVTASGFEIVDANDQRLPWEIDTWNTSGESLLWVLLPTYEDGATFTVRYGTAFPDAPLPATDVWAGYKGVWHMNAASPADASGSGNNGTTAGNAVTAAGQIGSAISLPTTSDYVTCGKSLPNSQLASGFTVEGWANLANTSGKHALFGKKQFISVRTDDRSIQITSPNIKDHTAINNAIPVAGTWFHWVLTFVPGNSGLNFYTNGVLANTQKAYSFKDSTTATEMWLGNNEWGAQEFLGRLDEMRLFAGIRSADWIAAEYHAMADADALVCGAVANTDATAPTFANAPTVVGSNNAFTFSATLDDGEGDLYMVFTDLSSGIATTNLVASGVTTPGTYTATPSLVSGRTYDYAVLGISPHGTAILKHGDSPVFAGDLTIVRTADADEAMMTDGAFTVSRGAATLGDLVVSYTVGGTAVAGETYEPLSGTVVIPDGATSATIAVIPIYSDAVQSDVTIVTTLAAGAYLVGTPDNATVTVVNGLTNPYVRYVSTTGNDANDGLLLASAKATVAAAVAEFDALAAGKTGTVYVAAGEYDIVPSGESCFTLTGAVHVVGMTGNPADVVLRRASGTARIAMLNHPEAVVQYLTLANGNILNGGNAYIDSNGGEILDCILTGGKNTTWNAHGAGAYLKAGRIARCRFLDNLQAAYGAGIYAAGGRVENCLVTGMTSGGGAVRMKGYSTLVNCTIAGNSATSCSGVWLEEDNKPKVVNCAIFANKTSNSTTGFVYNDASYGHCFVNCASEIEIPNGVNCVVGQPVFRDAAHGDFHLHPASCAIDAGTTGAAYTATSPTDLDGAARLADAIDIGCYETPKTTPSCGFTLQTSQSTVPAEVALEGASLGTSGNETYAWTFANDTAGTSESTDPSSSPSHVWTATAPGTYTVTLTVTDGAETVTYTLPSALMLAPDTLYVLDSNPDAAYPYDTEATAAPSVATAVDAAADGSTILVLPGATGVLKQTKQTVVEKGVRILGATGNPSDVVLSNDFAKINSDGCRIFILNHPDAFVANLTMTQGSVCANNSYGGDVLIKAAGGTVSNCVIRSGRARHFDSYGAAAYLYAGVLTHTEITGEFASMPPYNADPSNRGVVVHLNGSSARMENCLVHDLSLVVVSDSTTCGPIVAANPGTVRNCTIVPNCQMPDWSSDHGSFMQYNGGAALYAGSSATIANCVAATLLATNGLPVAFSGTAARYSNCAGDSGTVWAGTDCIDGTAADFFKNYAQGNYAPNASGPLVGTGLAYADMAATDLVGHPRLVGQAIDIGAYEVPPSGTLIILQ